jgi:polysaccharide biosynthesis/export protein
MFRADLGGTGLQAIHLWVVCSLLTVTAIAPAAAAAEATAGYHFNPGDLVRVSVWREEELDRQALVQPDGTISFPLVGQIAAAGRTPQEVQGEIVKRIETYIPEPVVTVELLEARGNKVYVIGEVEHPGEYQLGRPITAVQAISLAGGFTPFAGRGRIQILRRDASGDTSIPFDYNAVADGKNLAGNIELLPGDTVIVPGGSLF